MNRLLVCVVCFAVVALFPSCSAKQTSTTSNQTETKPSSPPATEAKQSAEPGELQPGQASGSYTDKGEVVELKYAYAGRAERFGTQSLVVLLTDKPFPLVARGV